MKNLWFNCYVGHITVLLKSKFEYSKRVKVKLLKTLWLDQFN